MFKKGQGERKWDIRISYSPELAFNYERKSGYFKHAAVQGPQHSCTIFEKLLEDENPVQQEKNDQRWRNHGEIELW